MDSADAAAAAAIAKFGRKFAAMVCTQGPDPKRLKMRKHAVHLNHSGSTTLSASGIFLREGSLSALPAILDHVCTVHQFSGSLVMTVASVVEPFLIAEQRRNCSQELFPRLIPYAQIDVLVESEDSGNSSQDFVKSNQWIQSRLLALIDVSASSDSLMSLVGSHNGSEKNNSWDVGWSLVHPNDNTYFEVNARHFLTEDRSNESSDLSLKAKLATRVAIIGIPTTQLKNDLHIEESHSQENGDMLLVVGSPFGILSPSRFFNSICFGAVSNHYPPGSTKCWLLIADARCLPGMEGSPVFDRHGHLVGMLTSPLRHKNTNAEIQLVITWEAIASANITMPQKKYQDGQEEATFGKINNELSLASSTVDTSERSSECLPRASIFSSLSPSSSRRAFSSVVLVKVGDGSWASGIIINQHGLVLTNAHLLEPWRFKRASLLDPITRSSVTAFKDHVTLKAKAGSGEENSKDGIPVMSPSELRCENVSRVRSHESLSNHKYQKYETISVRFDHMGQYTWCNASAVYVSKGPIDVALLQLESVSTQLCPIEPEFACPSEGLPVYVIGHGLFGPQSDMCPSVSSGVVSNVYRTSKTLYANSSSVVETNTSNIPVMLQTTAAVHPGASGGAVVNAEGRMIGLVTSNTRHGHRSIIPHMNFSIPSAMLEPVFKFAENKDFSTLKALDGPNEILSSIWALMPPTSLPPVAHKNDHQEVKGSRFAKFLSENQDIKQLIKMKPQSKM